MTARHLYSTGAGLIDVTDRVQTESWQAAEKAEEGSPAGWSVVLADPAMDLDIVGWQRYLVVEDDSTSDDKVIAGGFTGNQVISRGEAEGDSLEPLGRTWKVSISDTNTAFGMRVMVGTDCNRPAETDVARMQWLLSTAEAGLFDDVTTYVSTASPVDMDALDCTGQMFNTIADDCAQQSGKNWYAWWRYDAGLADYQLTAWYGKDSVNAYVSTLSLSNDPTDWIDAELADGTSLVWPIEPGAELERDPSRQYSGNYLPFTKGAVFRTNPALWSSFKRDFVSPSATVSTVTAANARATRQLTEIAEQDHRITTSVQLPKEIATLIRTGMRIRFRATHLPGYSAEFQWCRVLSCTPRPIAAGSKYELALELSKSTGTFSMACSLIGVSVLADGNYAPLLAGAPTSRADGLVEYWRSGLTFAPLDNMYPVPSAPGHWHYGVYNSGGHDQAGGDVGNHLFIYTTGPGTITVHTVNVGGPAMQLTAKLRGWDSVASGYLTVISSQSGIGPGADITFTVPADGACYHLVDIIDNNTPGSGWGFSGYSWSNA
jgi:hypothetical protein